MHTPFKDIQQTTQMIMVKSCIALYDFDLKLKRILSNKVLLFDFAITFDKYTEILFKTNGSEKFIYMNSEIKDK